MPIATNVERVRERLTGHPLPSVPPQTRWTTRDLADATGVSLQAIYLWQVRRSGPPRSMNRGRRASYRVGDVLWWLHQDGPTGDDRCRAFLAHHMRLAKCATALMKPDAGAGTRDALARLDALSGAELEAVCDALERVKCPWPKAKAAEVITTIEGVASHG